MEVQMIEAEINVKIMLSLYFMYMIESSFVSTFFIFISCPTMIVLKIFFIVCILFKI